MPMFILKELNHLNVPEAYTLQWNLPIRMCFSLNLLKIIEAFLNSILSRIVRSRENSCPISRISVNGTTVLIKLLFRGIS
jgi:hypothetical protein